MTAAIIPILSRAAGYTSVQHLADISDLREEARERVRKRHIYAPPNASAIRDNIRKNAILNVVLLADPVNAWRRGQLELNLSRALDRYRLALSSYIAEGPLPLPDARAERRQERAAIMEAAE